MVEREHAPAVRGVKRAQVSGRQQAERAVRRAERAVHEQEPAPGAHALPLLRRELVADLVGSCLRTPAQGA
jgi:hypothetical protein